MGRLVATVRARDGITPHLILCSSREAFDPGQRGAYPKREDLNQSLEKNRSPRSPIGSNVTRAHIFSLQAVFDPAITCGDEEQRRHSSTANLDGYVYVPKCTWACSGRCRM